MHAIISEFTVTKNQSVPNCFSMFRVCLTEREILTFLLYIQPKNLKSSVWPNDILSFRQSLGYVVKWWSTQDKDYFITNIRNCTAKRVVFHRYHTCTQLKGKSNSIEFLIANTYILKQIYSYKMWLLWCNDCCSYWLTRGLYVPHWIGHNFKWLYRLRLQMDFFPKTLWFFSSNKRSL